MLKGKRFYYVIAIVTVLLLGLIVTQVYWVRNTAKLQQEDFNKKINLALANVIAQAEDVSYSFYLYSRSYIQPGQGISIVKRDTTSAIIDTMQLFNIFPYNDRPDTCFYTTGTSYYDHPVMVSATLRFEYLRTKDLPDLPRKNKDFAELTFNNFRQKLNDSLPITTRIRTGKLDSLIKAQLAQTGVNVSFRYGLRKKGQQAFEYLSDSTSHPGKHTNVYSALLFNDIAYSTPYELVLYIQDKQNCTNTALAGALGMSSLIIMLLAAAFIYFAFTVLRQKKLSQMKTDFINNMTHEFMTPVTNIALALETLEKTTNPQNARRIMDVIGTENTLLKDNIHKVLQVAVLDKGNMLLDPTPVDLHELLHRIARNFSIQVENRKGHFEFALNAAQPVIIADETHIINLFYNIIDNAVKYASEQPLCIKVSSGITGRKLWVSIEDNGIGMNNATQKNIFEKFYRGATGDKHDVKGFGLGLSYVKSIADAHKITIDVVSMPGKGTTFTIWFNKRQ